MYNNELFISQLLFSTANRINWMIWAAKPPVHLALNKPRSDCRNGEVINWELARPAAPWITEQTKPLATRFGNTPQQFSACLFSEPFNVAKTPGIHRFLNYQIHDFACLSCSCCRLSGSLRIRFAARLLDLIRSKSALHLNSSTFSALDLRNAILASPSATPTFVANVIELGFSLGCAVFKGSNSHLNTMASLALKICMNPYILLLVMDLLHSLP